jgi:hypothetical protein
MELAHYETRLLDKLRNLPEDKLLEIEDFIDFLTQRSQDERLVKGAMKLSESSFARVWDKLDDADYDEPQDGNALRAAIRDMLG